MLHKRGTEQSRPECKRPETSKWERAASPEDPEIATAAQRLRKE
jgi:hypothetical protein